MFFPFKSHFLYEKQIYYFYLSSCGCLPHVRGCLEKPRESVGPGLGVVSFPIGIRVPGPELGSSGRAALTDGVISPASYILNKQTDKQINKTL